MKKQFIVNIFLLVLLNLLVKPFWVLGVDRTVQNMVGSEAYGLYFALFNLTILFNTFIDLGINGFNNRSIAQSPQLIQTYFPRLIVSKLLLAILYAGICLATAVFLGYSHTAFKLIIILTINQILASFLLFLRSNISGLQMYIADSILSVTDRLILILLCSILLWTSWFPVKMDIFLFAWLQTCAYACAALAALVIMLSKTGRISFKHVPVFSFGLFRKSLPFALLGLLMVIHNRSDAILIERLLPDGAFKAGIYAQSFRIFDAITMISVLFASLLLPMFSKQLSKNENIRPLTQLAFSFLFTGTVSLAIIFNRLFP
ncbi:MAG: oligosaccharide flippase family protein [Bacteroidetes bacterium]|nr:oligosaccharide flippase family protein [Bacteroidota bacterium]